MIAFALFSAMYLGETSGFCHIMINGIGLLFGPWYIYMADKKKYNAKGKEVVWCLYL
jgi:hypothetical protein